MADLIAQAVRQAGVGGSARLAAVRRAWRDAVGRELAEQTRVVAFRGGVVTVEVESAALGQELSVYYKPRLLGHLSRETGVRVTDLRCRITGKASEAPSAPPKSASPGPKTRRSGRGSRGGRRPPRAP